MRVAIYDGILESHLALSLQRALVQRGHNVYNTGRIGKGFNFPTDHETISRLESALDQVLDFKPDVILVFRPASMPFALLKRARASKAILMAWFSDDPVLWKLSYGPVVDLYDVILHCGNSQVLRFYENRHGRPTGINFPFWTDNESFPHVYRKNPMDSEAMFLGNTKGQIRQRRYWDLAELNSNVKIYGSVDEDTRGIWGGRLDSDAEVVDAASRSLIGINIPQLFSDHEGLPTWFEGLGELTFFQYPSRVIQYAAMGLPIISLVPNEEYLNTFPEIVCVSNSSELDRCIRRLVDETDLLALSKLTHSRFQRNYSSEARVIAIEALVNDDVDWRSMNVEERTSLYMTYEASSQLAPKTLSLSCIPEREKTKPQKWNERLENHLENVSVARCSRRIAVTGTGWTQELSELSTTVRALRLIGHEVLELNPYRKPECFREDQKGVSRLRLNVGPTLMVDGRYPEVIIFVGDWVSICPTDAIALKEAGCILLHLATGARPVGLMEQKMASLMDYTTVVDPTVVESFHEHGLSNVGFLPKLVDRAFIRALLESSPRVGSVGFLAVRAADLEFYETFISSVDSVETSTFALHPNDRDSQSMATLAGVCRSDKVLVFPESRNKKSNVNPLLGYGLVSGALPFTLRRPTLPIADADEQYSVSVLNEKEFLEKIHRVGSGTAWSNTVKYRALEYGLRYFAAEERLSELMTRVLSDR